MKDGFIKAAAVTPEIKVAEPKYNTESICEKINECEENGAKIIVFPELCITGATCGDLFFQETLLKEAVAGLKKIALFTEKKDVLVFVGLPVSYKNRLYNAVAAVNHGKILGLVPKYYISNNDETAGFRYFAKGTEQTVSVMLDDTTEMPMGRDLLFSCETLKDCVIGAEIGEDFYAPKPTGVSHALAGATILVNPYAESEIIGKREYKRELVKGQSARLFCGYICAGAGYGESTQDTVFSAQNIIAENGNILAESETFSNEIVYSEIDVQKLSGERRKNNLFEKEEENTHETISFSVKETETKLSRFISASPFIPTEEGERKRRCKEILSIQTMGLKKRLEHTHSKCAVVGISGGLDSTLALLVTVRAFDSLGLDRSGIKAITMPGFGTTDRTYTNAVKMIEYLRVSFREVSIKEAVNVHFKDIAHDSSVHDVTYENAQARERTQILMDIANKEGGMVIGTGDLSELALGWATYNGDHMSMYGVNAAVPKTLVRHLVRYYADTCGEENLSEVLLDVLDTPVSPELLPPEDGKISQKTEDIVGPYELHDFFLYYMIRFGYSPKKIYRLAELAFDGIYEKETILKWLKNYYRRFFTQQFKRSCLPDGPKVGSVGVSPRGDLKMPSDACAKIWQDEAEQIVISEK